MSYSKSLVLALLVHLLLVFFLFAETWHKNPLTALDMQHTEGKEQTIAQVPDPEIVKAVTLDNKEVLEAINRIKEQRIQKQRAEQNRIGELNRQAEVAKQQRIREQKRIAQLKEEADTIAIARKKQAEAEKKRLDELAEKKRAEEKKLAELKRQQAQEKAQLEKKKRDQDKAKEASIKRQKQAEQAAAEHAAEYAQKQAQISGEVNKYKALIVNAISRHWILPENADSSLSSQFRIRLAPDGMVLDVSLTRSSGDPLLDRSAQTAIYKASPLPVPADPETFNLFRDISLTVRPEQIRG